MIFVAILLICIVVILYLEFVRETSSLSAIKNLDMRYQAIGNQLADIDNEVTIVRVTMEDRIMGYKCGTDDLFLKESILKSLALLIEKAKKEGLVIQCSYDSELIFTPEEFETEHGNGKFIWGAVHWKLIDPEELIKEAQSYADTALKDLEKLKLRFGR